jgi:hypothetical protein
MTANLEKNASRWLRATDRLLFDEEYADSERLPRRFVAELREPCSGTRGSDH